MAAATGPDMLERCVNNLMKRKMETKTKIENERGKDGWMDGW